LTCGLGLTLAVAALYWLARPRKKLDDALKESHYEKFQRLVGFYLTIPETVRNQPENAAAARSFETQRIELEKDIDPKTRKFQRDDADDLVHNLHLALLQVATIDYLRFNLQALEAEYRQAAGPTAYEAYLTASTPKPTDPPVSSEERDRLLRSEATYLVNETRRQQQLRQHVQSTRQSLLKAAFRSWWMSAIPLLAMVLVFLACMSGVETAMEPRSSKTGDWTVELAVPDALDALAKQQADNNAKATPGAGARNLPAHNQGQTAVAGAKNDFKQYASELAITGHNGESGGARSNESAGSDSYHDPGR